MSDTPTAARRPLGPPPDYLDAARAADRELARRETAACRRTHVRDNDWSHDLIGPTESWRVHEEARDLLAILRAEEVDRAARPAPYRGPGGVFVSRRKGMRDESASRKGAA